MKILFIQRLPCIRNWKYAWVLKRMGHEVYLAQMVDALRAHWTLPVNCYREIFMLSSNVALNRIIPYFDIVHCHNEPDWWTCMALSAAKDTGVPVIHDCHDWIPGRQQVSIDGMACAVVANSLSQGVVYVSEIQKTIVADRLGDKMAPAAIVHNYPVADFIPGDSQLKPKVGGKYRNLVYSGTLSKEKTSHRFFLEEFKALVHAGYAIYVYAPSIPKEYQDMARAFPGRMILKGHVPYTNLIEELSQYDIGLLPFQKTPENIQHLDSGLPNKLFEYLAAGLPVACKAGLIQQERFIQENWCGFMYSSPFDFGKNEKAFMDTKPAIDRFKFTFEHDVQACLLPMYYEFKAKREPRKFIGNAEAILKFKRSNIEIEFYEDGKGYSTGLYGMGHDCDLRLENYLAANPEGSDK
jgi:glycosyltransferase involved in cell wall biosynthesis